jgi:hypothetical protein
VLANLAAAVAAANSQAQNSQAYPKYLRVAGDSYSCFGKVVQRDVCRFEYRQRSFPTDGTPPRIGGGQQDPKETLAQSREGDLRLSVSVRLDGGDREARNIGGPFCRPCEAFLKTSVAVPVCKSIRKKGATT